jgi:hypothetical protein
MAATAVFDEVQVTSPVTSLVEPSLNQPSAVKRWVAPAGMLVLAGEITMPLRATSPAQVVRDRAKDPKNNIRKTKLIFLIIRTPGKETTRHTLRDAGSRRLKANERGQTPFGANQHPLDSKKKFSSPAPGTCRAGNLKVFLSGDKSTEHLPHREVYPSE